MGTGFGTGRFYKAVAIAWGVEIEDKRRIGIRHPRSWVLLFGRRLLWKTESLYHYHLAEQLQMN